MSVLKQKFDARVNSFYATARTLLSTDLAPERVMFQQLFARSLLKGILAVVICLLLFAGSVYLNYRWLYGGLDAGSGLSSQEILGAKSQINLTNSKGLNSSLNNNNNHTQKAQSTFNLPTGVGGTGNNTEKEGENQAFQNVKDLITSFTGPLSSSFDSFVFTTVDPTGFSEIQADKSIQFEPSISSDKKLKIGSGSYLFSTMKYSNLFNLIAGGILFLLVVLSGYQIMTNENGEVLGDVVVRFKRIVVAALLLFGLAPFLLSMSVVATQLVNQQIIGTGNSDCRPNNSTDTISYSECVLNRVTSKFRDVPAKVEIDGWDLGGYINRFIFIASGYFKNIPSVLLFLVILLLLFVILIQFVVRYINLYFLFAFYPIVVVFWAFGSTQNYCREYVKNIVTLLLHQPFFILAFMIFADISAGLVNTTGGFELPNLLLYTIFLGALTTIPSMVAARIFGDVSAAYEHARHSRRSNLPGRSVAAVGDYGNDKVRGLRDNAVKLTERGVSKVGGYAYQAGMVKLTGKSPTGSVATSSRKKTVASSSESHVKKP